MADLDTHSETAKPKDSKSITYSPVWESVPGGRNMVLENDEFRISYNPIARAIPPKDQDNPIAFIAQGMGGMFNGEGEPQEETALYDNKVWRILLGDFRIAYQAAFPSLEKCLKVYEDNKAKYRSGWSTDDPVTDLPTEDSSHTEDTPRRPS